MYPENITIRVCKPMLQYMATTIREIGGTPYSSTRYMKLIILRKVTKGTNDSTHFKRSIDVNSEVLVLAGNTNV